VNVGILHLALTQLHDMSWPALRASELSRIFAGAALGTLVESSLEGQSSPNSPCLAALERTAPARVAQRTPGA
jgi:hypothetical protein